MYSLGNSAPVVNPGYYDVPIQNQYSNPVRQGNEIKLSNYALYTTSIIDTIDVEKMEMKSKFKTYQIKILK